MKYPKSTKQNSIKLTKIIKLNFKSRQTTNKYSEKITRLSKSTARRLNGKEPTKNNLDLSSKKTFYRTLRTTKKKSN